MSADILRRVLHGAGLVLAAEDITAYRAELDLSAILIQYVSRLCLLITYSTLR